MKVKLTTENPHADYIQSLLRARGITDVDRFLHPTADALQQWGDLEDIEVGVSLVVELPARARVALVVDSDVDGYTSAAIIAQYLMVARPDISICPYLHKGKAHGLEEHWEEIRDDDYDLIILPDAGSNDEFYANQIACSILVLDHHLVDTEPAPNMVVINNQTSPFYKNKNLSGAGVTFQFCRALDAFYGKNWADQFIDLAATGICGDMMSGLEIENQYIWREGFNHVENPFLRALAEKQAYSITGQTGLSFEEIMKKLNPMSVAFYIVPLINAMIRVGTMSEKERMFQAFIDGERLVESQKRGAKGELVPLATESARECTNARSKQNRIKDEAVARLEQQIFKHDLLENQILFIRLDQDDPLPSELTGLIAMQLSQKYKHPTMIGRINNEGFVRGSIRGLNNSELVSFKDYLDSTGLFEYVQGHANAAGYSISNKSLAELHNRANNDLSKMDFGENYYEVDFERQAYSDDLVELIDTICQYKDIWSQGCGEPLIYIKDLHFSQADIQVMGKNGDTLKIEKNGIAYMKFFAKDLINEFKELGCKDIKVEVVGKANLNFWMGRVTPQIFIENIQIMEDKLTDF